MYYIYGNSVEKGQFKTCLNEEILLFFHLEDRFVTVKTQFSEKIVPAIRQLLDVSHEQEGNKAVASCSNEEDEEFMTIIKEIVEQSLAHPLEVLANVSLLSPPEVTVTDFFFVCMCVCVCVMLNKFQL